MLSLSKTLCVLNGLTSNLFCISDKKVFGHFCPICNIACIATNPEKGVYQ